MKKRSVVGLFVVSVLLCAYASYVWAGWSVARAVVVAVATGETVEGLGPPDPDFASRLGQPNAQDVTVHTVVDAFDPPGLSRLTFVFCAENATQEDSLMLLGVDVRLSLRGWHVMGYGWGG